MFDSVDLQYTARISVVAVAIFGVCLAVQGIWRLYISPIANFPGPKLAAVTYWYEFYYDIILRGQYIFKIWGLHEKYGPIIQINPHELHVIDPDFFETLYAGGNQKRDRDPWHTNAFNVQGSVLGSPSHDLHRNRRIALSPFFSMSRARKLQPLVEESVNKLINRFIQLQDSGNAVNLMHAYSAFSYDVIMDYCFNKSCHSVENEDFDVKSFNLMVAGAHMTALMKHLSFIPKLLQRTPEFVAVRISNELSSIIAQRKKYQIQIEEVKNEPLKSETNRDAIFHTLLKSNLPASEKKTDRLIDEAIVFVGAGTHTVAWALTVATFHILSDPSILRKLKEELQQNRKAVQDCSLPELEKLPYLTAVIKEGLRLSYGTSARIPRIARDTNLQYKDWVIPKGTSVSMTAVLLHQNEAIFPDAGAFKPERWLQDTYGTLDRSLVAFNAGTRICLGINIAWSEMYICLSKIFSTFGGDMYRDDGDKGILQLFKTRLEDVVINGDMFFPVTKEGSKGVRIRIST